MDWAGDQMNYNLLRIMAFNDGKYTAEIWLATYLRKEILKDLAHARANLTSLVTPTVAAEFIARQRGWYVTAFDPKFKLGKFERIYKLTVPDWRLEEITKDKVYTSTVPDNRVVIKITDPM